MKSQGLAYHLTSCWISFRYLLVLSWMQSSVFSKWGGTFWTCLSPWHHPNEKHLQITPGEQHESLDTQHGRRMSLSR